MPTVTRINTRTGNNIISTIEITTDTTMMLLMGILQIKNTTVTINTASTKIPTTTQIKEADKTTKIKVPDKTTHLRAVIKITETRSLVLVE